MGIFSRLSDIINSNINSILDSAEDPEKIIRLIIQEMEDTLVEVRSATVKTIADRKETERRIDSLRKEADGWEKKAESPATRAPRTGSRSRPSSTTSGSTMPSRGSSRSSGISTRWRARPSRSIWAGAGPWQTTSSSWSRKAGSRRNSLRSRRA